MTWRAEIVALRRFLLCLCLTCGAVFGTASGGAAQQTGAPAITQLRSPVLVIDVDVFYRDSAFGRRILADVERAREELAAENRAIETALTKEERDLTDLRAQTPPDTFSTLADAFDQKVRTIRREQDSKARALSRTLEDSRGEFLSEAAPVLEALMVDAGAAVVLDRRSVFLTRTAIDITREAIARMDQVLGDGTQLQQNTLEQAGPGRPGTE